MIRKKFHSVIIESKEFDLSKPILLISNHVSWWDGFWAMYINLKLFKKKFYFMMHENQLLKYKFFNQTGGFSINNQYRHIIDSINYSSSILDDKNNLLVIYPQGEINSIYQSEFVFKRGIEKIIKEKDISLIFSANLIDYFSCPKPSVYIYLEQYLGDYNLRDIQKAYNDFYKNSTEKQIHREK
ncbi:MAG: 1-acyl-sn-glycerol-3-phosphate acyltransferase [Bacteroidales bacterium]|nr:1-acyl-sn-glycerol-3-phosphate acyltransferase [Bacteroidales bacterium]MDD4703147.1 1-acyl-sn-glycerol-3-phosphate acyltransferase [Bacteroidales bacterium]MDX9797627.1 1-acyl-sn-glycerol-3-phosphate acyltransferase [Bacteroidales bacterium]